MKKLPEDQKARRISTSIPADIDDWINSVIESAAQSSPFGEGPSKASIVTQALREAKRIADERRDQAAMDVKREVGKTTEHVKEKLHRAKISKA